MNDYLNEVVDHLQEIPEDDRFDLIQYYEEYFLDSGKTLDQVIDEYGTPKAGGSNGRYPGCGFGGTKNNNFWEQGKMRQKILFLC